MEHFAGKHLGWRAFGSGATTLTCLHPIGLNGEWFSAFSESWGDEYRLICPDLPGHALTPPREGSFDLTDLADDVVHLWDELDIERSAVLGVSLGGMVVQGIVARHPERVSTAILMCTTDGFDDASKLVLRDRARKAREQGGMEDIIEATVSRWFSANEVEARGPLVEQARKDLECQAGETHARYWTAMAELDFLDALSWTTAAPPTLIVAGQNDQSFQTSIAERMASRIEGSELHVLPGGHLFPFEYPDSVAPLVLEFLQRARSG